MSNELQIEQYAVDITGEINGGLPVLIVKIKNNMAEVHYIEPNEGTSKIAEIDISRLTRPDAAKKPFDRDN